jgi:hypothetical protein
VAGLGRGRKITQAKKAPEAIEKAALLLEEKGWCTGGFHKTTGTGRERFCASGALSAVATERAFVQARSALDEAASREGYDGILHYNDAQTDKRKVIRFMRRVARSLRQQAGGGTAKGMRS